MDSLLDRQVIASDDPAAGGESLPALATLISRLQRGLRRSARATMPGPALPQSQVEVLRLLHREPGLRVHEVAEGLHLAPNTTSTLVQQLIRLGYVERRVDTRDRRAARLELTAAARDRVARWRDARAAVLHHLLGSLSPSDRELLQAAMPALDRLADQLEAWLP
jgi:DNA-binding MarR family transcriptional regulator